MPFTREYQHTKKSTLIGSKTKYKEFLTGLAVGQRVGVRLASGAVAIDVIAAIVDGPHILISCHNYGKARRVRGVVIQLRSQGTFGADGQGLFASSMFLLPATPELERLCATNADHDDAVAGRMKWFSQHLWSPEDAIQQLARNLEAEANRKHGTWLDNHFALRDDRETTLTIFRRAYPDHGPMIDALIMPWYRKWRDEMGGAEKDATFEAMHKSPSNA